MSDSSRGQIKFMNWWGWGSESIKFPIDEKPNLKPWIVEKLDVDFTQIPSIPKLEDIELPPALEHHEFESFIEELIPTQRRAKDKYQRVLHSYGKSFPDLFKLRRGKIEKSPDLIVFPISTDEVQKILNKASSLNVHVIPFGGGTNIVGAVTVESEQTFTVSLDMKSMNEVVQIEKDSFRATLQAGMTGPEVEKSLNLEGLSLGHFPDSFEWSTLGGWIATRSAGMQSNQYGKIEHLTKGLKLIAPTGELKTLKAPADSVGIDLTQMIAGSEGIFGVITEATVEVHPLPPRKDYRGFLFPNFSLAVNALKRCHEIGCHPSMFRIQDPLESDLAMQFKKPAEGVEKILSSMIKAYLKRRDYENPCIVVVGIEGEEEVVSAKRKLIDKILKSHQAFPLGDRVGKSWDQDKFNMPYLRDYLMNYGLIADVAETSTHWENLVPLYEIVIRKFNEEKTKNKHTGWIGCHLSHSYQTGACLYFTFALNPKEKADPLSLYYHYKKLITETFLENGATLSHHHSIGTEHRPWLKESIGQLGIDAIQGIKEKLDPHHIMNPKKLE